MNQQVQVPGFSTNSSLPDSYDATEQLLQSANIATKEVLKRYLSVQSVGSIISSFSTPPQAVVFADEPRTFRHIGAGTCGTIFEIPGSVEVIKRAKSGYEEALWNDCKMHKRVVECFGTYAHLLADLKVPDCGGFVTHDQPDFLKTQAALLPTGYQEPTTLYFIGRIFPLPQSVRFALIDLFFPAQARSAAKEAETNKDCLVRLYLGKRRDPHRLKPRLVSLRNYNLCLDQMEELGLDTKMYAATMAKALSVMHWAAHIDADDVEFVLGRPATINGMTAHANLSYAELEEFDKPRSTIPAHQVLDFRGNTATMWLLDFNRCKKMFVKPASTETEDKKSVAAKRAESVQLAVDAFFRNDPYCPKPLSSNTHEQSLWKVFRAVYLITAKAVLEKEDDKELRGLPDRFISLVEITMKARLVQKAEAEARLAVAGSRGWEETS